MSGQCILKNRERSICSKEIMVIWQMPIYIRLSSLMQCWRQTRLYRLRNLTKQKLKDQEVAAGIIKALLKVINNGRTRIKGPIICIMKLSRNWYNAVLSTLKKPLLVSISISFQFILNSQIAYHLFCLGIFTVDFWLQEHGIAIEIDGPSHFICPSKEPSGSCLAKHRYLKKQLPHFHVITGNVIWKKETQVDSVFEKIDN